MLLTSCQLVSTVLILNLYETEFADCSLLHIKLTDNVMFPTLCLDGGQCPTFPKLRGGRQRGVR